MPGIVGILGSGPGGEHARLVRLMLASLVRRPAWPSGLCSEPALACHAGWVAAPGSYAARVSAASAADRIVAGEAHAAGPADRLAGGPAGEVPTSASLARLNGPLSGLLIDRRRRKATLFTDRCGAERLYYAEKEGCLYFASEAKALLRVLPELRRFDRRGLVDQLAYGCTIDGRTLYPGIGVIPGGSCWSVDGDGRVTRECYFRPSEWENAPPLSPADYQAAFEEAFSRVLPQHLDGPGPVGISLTGGLDTRMIMACVSAAQAGPAPVCYTYAGLSGDTVDVRIARRIAAVLGLQHHVLRVAPGFVADFRTQLDRTVHATDGCAGALAAHELELSAQARSLSGVRLTGNFGSEVLRHMSTFKPLRLDAGLLEPDLEADVRRVVQQRETTPVHPVTSAAFQAVPWQLYGLMTAARSELVFRTPYLDNAIVSLAYRAPPAERRSPRSALRFVAAMCPPLSRIPTDRGVSAGRGRWLARPVAALGAKLDYWYQEGLPSGLSRIEPALARLAARGLVPPHKFLPYRRWFAGELAGVLHEAVDELRRVGLPGIRTERFAALVDDHVGGRSNRLAEINAVLSLQAIDRMLLKPSCAAV